MAIALFRRPTTREVNKVVLIPVDQIVRNPSQPRVVFDGDAIDELARSIKENGLLQPIVVRRLREDCYELVAGERRTRAFRRLGQEQIPAIVEQYSDRQSSILALIENLQRKDLNYFEEANGIARLIQDMDITQQQASETLGKAQSTIANKLRLLRFTPELQRRITEYGLTERHARALLAVEESELAQVIEHVGRNNLNVRQTEIYIESRKASARPKPTRLVIIKDIRLFLNSINKAVSVMNMAGIPAQTVKKESEEYLEYIIRVPKTAAYSGRGKLQVQNGKLSESHC